MSLSGWSLYNHLKLKHVYTPKSATRDARQHYEHVKGMLGYNQMTKASVYVSATVWEGDGGQVISIEMSKSFKSNWLMMALKEKGGGGGARVC